MAQKKSKKPKKEPPKREKIAACPFCLNTENLSVQEVFDGYFQVECTCDAKGPFSPSPQMALKRWNRDDTHSIVAFGSEPGLVCFKILEYNPHEIGRTLPEGTLPEELTQQIQKLARPSVTLQWLPDQAAQVGLALVKAAEVARAASGTP